MLETQNPSSDFGCKMVDERSSGYPGEHIDELAKLGVPVIPYADGDFYVTFPRFSVFNFLRWWPGYKLTPVQLGQFHTWIQANAKLRNNPKLGLPRLLTYAVLFICLANAVAALIELLFFSEPSFSSERMIDIATLVAVFVFNPFLVVTLIRFLETEGNKANERAASGWNPTLGARV